MTVFLEGIAARFYRGIGPEVQYIAPFARMNFFIGANNAGKSIVLNLLASQLGAIKAGKGHKPLEGPERYRGRESGEFTLIIGRNAEAVADELIERHREKFSDINSSTQDSLPLQIKQICNELSAEDRLWTKLNSPGEFTLYPEPDLSAVSRLPLHWQVIWSTFTRLQTH